MNEVLIMTILASAALALVRRQAKVEELRKSAEFFKRLDDAAIRKIAESKRMRIDFEEGLPDEEQAERR